MQQSSSGKSSKKDDKKSSSVPFKEKTKKNFSGSYNIPTKKNTKKQSKLKKSSVETIAVYPKKKHGKKSPVEIAGRFFKENLSKKKSAEVYTEEENLSGEIRLNKYLSHAGVASRRKADELIKEGKVTVNGTVITEMGYKVTRHDKVEFEGRLLNPEKKYYLLLNKPKDFITTVSDEKKRKTVMDLIRSAYRQIKSPVKPRLYPVGRLDRNTTGVLLITNDGELAQKLTHPSAEIKKIYHVVLNKKLRKEDFDKIAEGGVVLEDGIAEVDAIAYPNPKNKAEVGVEIHTGKNRFVRRLFEALGYEIKKLDRVYFAGLTKKDLPRGKWRFLQEEEVRLLKHFV